VPSVHQIDRRYLLANLAASLWFDFHEHQLAWSCLHENALAADIDRILRVTDGFAGFQSLMQELEEWGDLVIAAEYQALCVQQGSVALVHEDFRRESCLIQARCDRSSSGSSRPCQSGSPARGIAEHS